MPVVAVTKLEKQQSVTTMIAIRTIAYLLASICREAIGGRDAAHLS